MADKKLLLVVDTDWFFLSHRLHIALAAREQGWDVVVVAADTGEGETIRKQGLGFRPAALIRTSVNPVHELRIVRELYKIYREERPDIVHQVTLKIIINGGIAARLAKVPAVVNAIAGLGHYFINPQKKWVVNFFFAPVFRLIGGSRNMKYIFQNTDDRDFFVARGWTKPGQAVIIKGSGVNLLQFAYQAEPPAGPVRVLCGTRLLKDKGILEFIGAAALLKPRFGEEVEFVLAGKIITENPTGITQQELDEWVSRGWISFIGFQKNMAACLAGTHVNVLPSYREGLPKSLIEACAIGRPIIATDVPGCRDVVENGMNGYLVPAKNIETLAEAIANLVTDKPARVRMGVAGREKAAAEFADTIVASQTLRVYAALIP